MFPNTFQDELYDNYQSKETDESSQYISTENMQEAIDIDEKELSSWKGNHLDFGKLQSVLSTVLIDPEVDRIINLVIKITGKRTQHNYDT